jgi:hypothetical protein
MPNLSSFNSKEEYNTWFRNYREKNKKKFLEYNKKYNKEWRKKNGYHNELNSKLRYPEKQKARRLLQEAVRQRKIKKQNCKVCGSKITQAHHEDYFKPYDVVWLCRTHHAEADKILRLKKLSPTPTITPLQK